MAILQDTPHTLVLKAGNPILNETTLTFDRGHRTAKLERSTFMIRRRAEEVPLREIADVVVQRQTDGASGAERYLPVMRLASGRTLVLPAVDERDEAEHMVGRMREFVGLKH